MSEFLCERYKNIEVYIPGEQPKDKKYIKLNANESNMAPSPKVINAITKNKISGMSFYSDPNSYKLRKAISIKYNVDVDQVFVGNGADEVLGFCFMSFFTVGSKVCFPEITYDFYRVYAKTYGLDMLRIPLNEDLSINVNDYINTDRHVILANPNNPTGLRISVDDIEKILKANKNRLVIIDEAYIDYNNESCIKLVNKYNNLIVVQTFSKSRNLAGAHIGFAISSKDIINDITSIKCSFNPFNLSEFGIEVGTAAIEDEEYFNKCIKKTIESREYTKRRLEKLGFILLTSHTNFLFGYHPEIDSRILTKKLKEEGILIRYYDDINLRKYFRMTIGEKSEMDKVLKVIEKITNLFLKV